MWISLLARFWYVVPIALLMASTAYYRHDASAEHEKRIAIAAEYEQFQVGVKLAGEAQNVKSKAKEEEDKQRKEKSDVENSKVRTDLAAVYDAYRRMRDSKGHSGSGLLPPASANAKSTGREAFDRAALDRALQEFDKGVLGLLERGDQAIADLNSARKWAQSTTEK